MKPNSSLRSFLLAGSLLASPITYAATYYWDSNGTTGGWGTAVGGTWAEPTASRWTTGTNSTTATDASRTIQLADSVNFGDGSANTLTGGTITVSGTVDATAITFGSSAGQIILDTGIINLAAAASITVNNATDTISSEISGAGTSLTKSGTGILVLTGANSYTGSTIINAGTINLGGGGTTGSLASTALTLAGGSLNYTRSDSQTETFTTTNINGGGVSSLSASTGNILNLGTVTRGTGGLLDFSSVGAGTVAAETASNDVTGIMAGLNFGNSWAVANGAGSAISGLADGSYTLTSVATTDETQYAGDNIDVDDNSGAPAAGITANSLRFSQAEANTLTLTGANTITSGGILVGSGVGGNLSTITGGTLTGLANKDLSIIQNNTSDGLTISSSIVNNTSTSVTKSGAGLLTLGGNNTFTGGLTINAGKVALVNAGALNSTAGSENAVTFGAGSTGILAMDGTSVVIRSLNTNAVAGTPFVENGNATPATLTIGNSANAVSNFYGVIRDGTGGGALTITKAGTGALDLGTSNTYTGGTNLNGATSFVLRPGMFGTGIITVNANTTMDADYGAFPTYTNALHVAGGATLTTTGSTQYFGQTFTGAVSGSGTIKTAGSGNDSNTREKLGLTSHLNTFTGTLANLGGTAIVNVNSLGDGGKLQLYSGTGGLQLGAGTATSLLFDTRQVELFGSSALRNDNASAAITFTVNTALTYNGTGVRTLTLEGSNTGANAFNGLIANNSGSAVSLTKAGGGTWILSNTANSYTGGTNISGGTLRFATGALGTTGAINASGGTLLWLPGNISDISNRLAMTAATTSTFNTNGNNVTFASAIGSSTTANFAKTGLGTLTLQGTNTFTTGTTALSGDGTLVLDYATNDNRKLPTGGFSSSGGTIVLKGGSATESSTSFTTSTAAGTFFVRDTGTAKINLNGFTLTSNQAVVSFSDASMATTDRLNDTTGILGAQFTVGDSWATSAASGTDINIVKYTGATIFNPASATTNATNYELTGGTTLTATRQVNTLRIVGDGNDQVLSLGSSGAFNLQTSNFTTATGNPTVGGLLYAGGGNDNYTITNTGTSTGRLVIMNGNGQTQHVNVYKGTLNLDVIVGSGSSSFQKTGEGTLVFNKANGYTGATRVYQGVLRLTGAGTLTAGTTVQNGAAIELGNGIAIANTSTLNITGTGVSDGGALRNVATTSSSYAAAITLGGNSRINSDSGTLTLSGGVVTSLFNDVTFGGAGNTTVSTVAISGAGGLVKDGGGTLTLSATNTYTGATNVNSGTLAITGTGSINTTSAINVAASGTLRYDSSTALTVAPTVNGSGVSNRAVLGGAGPINAAVTLNNLGDVLSPGNSPGIQSYTGGQSWASFSYDWEVNDFSDVTGLTAGSDFDQIGITGTLDLTGGSGSYILNVLGLTAGNVAGSVPNFSEINRSWTILTSSGLSGFNVANWTINTTGFTDPDTGAWALAQSGNNLVLSYTVVPEPRAALLGGLGMLMLLRRRKR